LNTPSRVSERIKEIKKHTPVNYGKLIPKKRKSTSTRIPRRDPVNALLGFRRRTKPAKTPKTEYELKLLAKRKAAIDKINAKEYKYDNFEPVYDFDESSDQSMIDDFYEEDEYHFIDQAMEFLDLPIEEKHNPKNFLPVMYDDHQHDSNMAKEIVEQLIEGELKKAQSVLKIANTKFNNINKKERHLEKKSREWHAAVTQLEKAKTQLVMIEWELNQQKIFLPYDSVYALKCVPVKNDRNKQKIELEYYAAVRNPNGKGFCAKKMPEAWMQENFKSEFLDKVNQQHSQKGWIFFEQESDEMKLVKDEDNFFDTLEELNIQHLYDYKPLRGDDQILVIKCEITYDQYAQYVKISKCEWFIMTEKQSCSATPMD
jgi:hypothetical protein